MSNVLRSTTFQLEFNGNDGITGVKTFTRAVRDADAVTEELNKTLGENATVTYKNVKTKQELAREARLVVTQFERTAKRTEKLTEHYKHLASTVDKTAEEIEVLNAVQSLGANATKQQQEQVADAVRQYQMLRGGVDGAQGSLRNFRGVMQNAGWQVQDTVVQLQMGTDAFIVLSQQGSQMASAFGPTGAIVGAFIAVAGVVAGALVPSLLKASDTMEDFTEEQKEVVENYKKLIEITDKASKNTAIRSSIGKLNDDFEKQSTVIEKAEKEIDRYTKMLGSASDGQVLQIMSRIENLNETIDEARDKQKELGKSIDEVFISGLEKATDQTGEARDELDSFIDSLQYQIDTLGNSERQIALYTATKLNATQADIDAINAKYDLLEAYDEEIRANKALMDEFREFEKFDEKQKKAEVKRREIANKALMDELREFERFDEEQERKKQRRKRESIRLYEMHERERRRIEKGQIDVQSGDDPVTAANRLLNANLTTLVEQRKQLKEDEYAEMQRIDKLIEGEVLRHNSIIAEAELQAVQNQIQVFSMAASQMQGLADLMATGVADVEAKTKEMSGFQKAMFVISQSIAAVQALVNGISLGMSLAALFPLAAPAMVSFGTGLGVASSTAIMATTFAGTFDKGGQIMSNEAGIVSEYGAELVNGALVMGAASVTSREDTAKLLNGDKSVKLSVEVQNQIPNASFQVQQLDEERVRIIAKQEFNKNIDSGVSNVLGNGNSKSAKSLRKNYDTKRRIQ